MLAFWVFMVPQPFHSKLQCIVRISVACCSMENEVVEENLGDSCVVLGRMKGVSS